MCDFISFDSAELSLFHLFSFFCVSALFFHPRSSCQRTYAAQPGQPARQTPRAQFNQDLYSTSGVPLTSSSASVSSHSPCSPILPQSVALNATQSGGSTTIPTIPLGSLHRSIAKEEDLSSVTRQSDNDGKCQSHSFLCAFLFLFLSVCLHRLRFYGCTRCHAANGRPARALFYAYQ